MVTSTNTLGFFKQTVRVRHSCKKEKPAFKHRYCVNVLSVRLNKVALREKLFCINSAHYLTMSLSQWEPTLPTLLELSSNRIKSFITYRTLQLRPCDPINERKYGTDVINKIMIFRNFFFHYEKN